MENKEVLEEKFIDTPREQNSPHFSHIFMYNKPDGGVGAINYTPELDENGLPKPLTQQSFYESLQNADTKRYTDIANSTQVPVQILQGIAKVEADRQSIEQKDRRVKSFDLFRFNDDTNKKYGPLASVEPSVVEEAGDEIPSKENSPSYAAAVAAHLAANILDSQNITDRNNLSNEQLGAAYREYVKQSSGRIATDEETASFVNEVRSYKADRRFVPSAQLPKDAFDGKAVQRYNSIIRYSKANQTFDDWYNDRGAVRGFWNADTSSTFAWLQRAIDLFTNPEQQFNTMLSDKEEKKFQDWFKDMQDKGMIAETDTGFDYDFRGAFKDGYKPVKQSDNKYHWTDKYKKPNHVTFSKESKYAEGLWAQYAGSWSTDKNGNVKYTPSNIQYPHAEQQLYYDMTKELEKTVVTSHDETYDPGSAELKRAKQRGLKLKIGGMTTGMAAGITGELIAMGMPGDRSTIQYVEIGEGEEVVDLAKGNVSVRPYSMSEFPRTSEFAQMYSNYPSSANMSSKTTKEMAGATRKEVLKIFTGTSSTASETARNEGINYLKYKILTRLPEALVSDTVVRDVTGGILISSEGVITERDVAQAFLDRYREEPYDTPRCIEGSLEASYIAYRNAAEAYGIAGITAQKYATPENRQAAEKARNDYNSARRKYYREGQIQMSVYTHLDPRILPVSDSDTAMNLISGKGRDITKGDEFFEAIKNFTIDAPDMAYVVGANILTDGNEKFAEGVSEKEKHLRAYAIAHMGIFSDDLDAINHIVRGKSFYQQGELTFDRKDLEKDISSKLTQRIKKLASPDKDPNGFQTDFMVMRNEMTPLIAAMAITQEKMSLADAKRNADRLIDTYASNFITSEKYGESITKAEQIDYGVRDADELNGMIMQAKNATSTAIANGFLLIQGSIDDPQEQMKALSDNVGKIQFFIMNGQICPYFKDYNGRMHRLVEKDGGAPYSIGVEAMKKANYLNTLEGNKFAEMYGNIWLGEVNNMLIGEDPDVPGAWNSRFVVRKYLTQHTEEVVKLAEVVLQTKDRETLKQALPTFAKIYANVMYKAKNDLYTGGRMNDGATASQVDKAVADSFKEVLSPNIVITTALQNMSPEELTQYLEDAVSAGVQYKMRPRLLQVISPTIAEKWHAWKKDIETIGESMMLQGSVQKYNIEQSKEEKREEKQSKLQELQDYMKGGK